MAYQTLHQRLRGPIASNLAKELGVSNLHALPSLEKVTVNVGINKSKMDSKETHKYVEECIRKITGQKPVFTTAKKAISNFKTREGMTVGCRVTLRGAQMEQFLDRLISYAIPRIRDFRGLSSKLDGHGNYSIGIRDHSIFPEVPAPDAGQIFGMQVVITTTATTDKEGKALLKEIGMPFRKEAKEKEAQNQSSTAADSGTGQAKEGKEAKEKKPEQNIDSQSNAPDTATPNP